MCYNTSTMGGEADVFAAPGEGADYMAVSKAQQRAVHKYVKDNYDRMELTVPKGRKAELKALAESRGQSVNAFVNEAIDAAVSGSVAQAGRDTMLTPKAITAALTASEAAGETVEAFIARAIETQAERDKLLRGLSG